MRVSNYLHKNQFLIEDNKDVYFQSYDSIIAKIDFESDLTLYENYDYSATTSRHLNKFLQEYYWRGQQYYQELIYTKQYSIKKALTIMIKKGMIIKGW